MKLAKKNLINQSALLLTIALIIFIFFRFFVIPNTNEQMYQKAREFTFILKNTLKYADDIEKQDKVSQIATNTKGLAYILLLDKTGKAVIHNDPTRIGKMFDDEGTLSAARDQKKVEQEYLRDKDNPASSHYRERCIDIVEPFYNVNGEHIGAINIGLSMKSVDQSAMEYYWLMGIAIVIIAIFIVIMWMRNNKMLIQPIIEISILANELSKGSLNFKNHYKNDDEIGDLFTSFDNMRDTIKSIITDINKLSEETTNGNLDYRADASSYRGEYKVVIERINATLKAVTDPMKNTIRMLEKLSNGELEIVTIERKGDLAKLKVSFNRLINTFRAMNEDVQGIIKEVQSGHFKDAHADESKHKGIYKEIISGLNDLIDVLNRLFVENSETIDKPANDK